MNRTKADLEAADKAAEESFGIDTDPQHRDAGLSAPTDQERQPAGQPENREPATADHNPLGIPDDQYADSGSTKETAVNYQGASEETSGGSSSSTGATEHDVQGKGRTSKK